MGFRWKGRKSASEVVEAGLYKTATKPDTSVTYLLVAVPLLQKGTLAMAQSPGEDPAPLPFLAQPLTQTCQQAH